MGRWLVCLSTLMGHQYPKQNRWRTLTPLLMGHQYPKQNRCRTMPPLLMGHHHPNQYWVPSSPFRLMMNWVSRRMVRVQYPFVFKNLSVHRSRVIQYTITKYSDGEREKKRGQRESVRKRRRLA